MRALKLTCSMVRSLLTRPASRPKLAIVALAGALSMTGACISVHAHRPVAAANYHHQHRLDCDHVVACHVQRGRHQQQAHQSHARYTHQHRTRQGHHVTCYVVRDRHSYMVLETDFASTYTVAGWSEDPRPRE